MQRSSSAFTDISRVKKTGKEQRLVRPQPNAQVKSRGSHCEAASGSISFSTIAWNWREPERSHRARGEASGTGSNSKVRDDVILPRAVLYTSMDAAWWCRLRIRFLFILQYITWICTCILSWGTAPFKVYVPVDITDGLKFKEAQFYAQHPTSTSDHVLKCTWLYKKGAKNRTYSGENISNNTLSLHVSRTFTLPSLQLFNLHKQNAENQPY